MADESMVRTQADPLEQAMGAMKDDDTGIDDLPKAEHHEAVEEVSELGGEKICQIEPRFETFVRQVKQTITKMLQTSLSCQLGKIQSGSWATLDNTYQSAKASYQLRASCLPKDVVLHIDADLAHAVVNRMLGGTDETSVAEDREFTMMESRLMLRFATELATSLQQAIDPERVSAPCVQQLDASNRYDLDLGVGPSCTIIPLRIEWSNQRGVAALLLPQEVVNGLLASDTCEKSDSADDDAFTSKQILDMKLDVSVVVAKSKVKTADLLSLKVGDIITTERSVKDPLDLVVQGVPKFKVTPGAHQGNKAVKIVHAIDQPDR